MNKSTFRNFRRIAVATALTTAITGASVMAQDSTRDRLSPGNGVDWAGEIHAGPNEYDQSVNRNRYDNEYYGYDTNGAYQPRSVSPTYYRDSRTGRYFRLDDNNRAVFDQSTITPGRSMPQRGQYQSNQFSNNQGQPQYFRGQPQYNQGQPQYFQGQPQYNQGQPQQGQFQYSQRQSNQGQNNQGPLLGVALEDTKQGIRVVDVARNSAAQEAGIQPGDVIVEFNGTASSDLNAGTFTSQVGQMNAGDRLTLVVNRNGQEKELKATLGGQSSNRRYQSAKTPMQGESPAAIKQRLEELRTKVDRLEQKLDEMTEKNSQKENNSKSAAGENQSDQSNAQSDAKKKNKANKANSQSNKKNDAADRNDSPQDQPSKANDGSNESDSNEDSKN